ncbi:flagellar protein FlgN [Variovorax sp. NFACC27]|jgi:flagella synthesis protein FlgN|uniref:flagella synthesis protein FlgN n=1 Tax=Variovorax TaxID=34072 RepID=UPI000898ACCF|nr:MULTISPECIES: flagellar protein FlgN [Variovorax]MDP9604111.1 flagella synthesis protein FlgN [Variovorax paradoxus]SEF26944.1 flagella synthesis protein FlgN [Variovorax sp. NFACC28]SEG62546.1 flagella synthesis protein FlgN [Variovorax sp. NFACC29]SFC63629.1 flagella synthesis protein FlgN [Variovorax sp. NFACC26]SFG83122.1 flagella synthesis protein FlgN [Variovorax sp. NFACC27]
MKPSLLGHLRTETACIEEFLSVLDQEALAMSDRAFTDLASIATRKTVLLERMAELDAQREALQATLGFGPGRAGADAAAAAGGAEVERVWQTLLQVAGQAREHNLRNGSMVYAHLDFTQQALHFLQASAQLFYGPDGVRKTQAGSGNRLAAG